MFHFKKSGRQEIMTDFQIFLTIYSQNLELRNELADELTMRQSEDSLIY